MSKLLRKTATALLITSTVLLTYTPYIYVPVLGKPGQLKQVRIAQIAHADSVGPTGAGTASATNEGTCTDNWNWTAASGDLQTNDSAFVSYAVNNWDSGDITDKVYAENFGFNVSGTVDGIVVDVLAWTTAGGGSYNTVQLYTSQGANVGSNKAAGSLPTSDPGSTFQSFGASNDTWSAGLTASQVNATTFGVGLCFAATAANSRANVDQVRITVYYTPPQLPPTVATNAITSYGTFFGDFSATISDTGGSDATEHGFTYGTDSTLANPLATTTLGGYTGTGNFSQRIDVLQNSTQYWVRAYATNANGTGYGSIQSFTTHADVPSRTLRLISGKLKINQGSRLIIYQRN